MSGAWVLVGVALAFAVVNGLNDGGAVLAVGLRVDGVQPLAGLVLIATGVALVPIVAGTAVATTLASRLVTFDGVIGRDAMLVAVVAAVVVTGALGSRGLPTSLTLGLVGAIGGAGVGADLPVQWTALLVVLVLAAVAPVVGLLLARLLVAVVTARSPTAPVRAVARRWHLAGFGLLCVAYGANDGQKMLAVMAVATGAFGVSGAVDLGLGQLAVVALAFLIGAAVGLPRMAGTMATGMTQLRAPEAAITEVASAGVVLATGALGSPVSMTQAIAGGLVGTSIPRGWGSIRWGEVARVGGAWVITLPATFAVAAALAVVAVLLRG
jgi:inorganic phosphate transporter, PiT family